MSDGRMEENTVYIVERVGVWYTDMKAKQTVFLK